MDATSRRERWRELAFDLSAKTTAHYALYAMDKHSTAILTQVPSGLGPFVVGGLLSMMAMNDTRRMLPHLTHDTIVMVNTVVTVAATLLTVRSLDEVGTTPNIPLYSFVSPFVGSLGPSDMRIAALEGLFVVALKTLAQRVPKIGDFSIVTSRTISEIATLHGINTAIYVMAPMRQSDTVSRLWNAIFTGLAVIVAEAASQFGELNLDTLAIKYAWNSLMALQGGVIIWTSWSIGVGVNEYFSKTMPYIVVVWGITAFISSLVSSSLK